MACTGVVPTLARGRSSPGAGAIQTRHAAGRRVSLVKCSSSSNSSSNSDDRRPALLYGPSDDRDGRIRNSNEVLAHVDRVVEDAERLFQHEGARIEYCRAHGVDRQAASALLGVVRQLFVCLRTPLPPVQVASTPSGASGAGSVPTITVRCEPEETQETQEAQEAQQEGGGNALLNMMDSEGAVRPVRVKFAALSPARLRELLQQGRCPLCRGFPRHAAYACPKVPDNVHAEWERGEL
jgi:hypothetical protein